jgi:hypothetical protein
MSVFAEHVERTTRSQTDCGTRFKEWGGTADFGPDDIVDEARFLVLAKALREQALTHLGTLGGPVNFWRIGQLLIRVRAAHEAKCERCGQVVTSEESHENSDQ